MPYVPFHPSFLDGVWITTAAMRVAVFATILPARGRRGLAGGRFLRFRVDREGSERIAAAAGEKAA